MISESFSNVSQFEFEVASQVKSQTDMYMGTFLPRT